MDLDASTRIGVATTVGTYKASAPAPSDLELISSERHRRKNPGADLFMEILWRKTLRFGALHFRMNGLHLNQNLEKAMLR